jgi:hypothetical protein
MNITFYACWLLTGLASFSQDDDGNMYTTLMYSSGPGYRYNQTMRHNVTAEEARK